MGRFARPALSDAIATDSNPEIRFRCQRLLPKANALDLRARMDTFLADTEGQFQHDLPGWNQFRTAVGAERRVFGIPVRTDRALAQAADAAFDGEETGIAGAEDLRVLVGLERPRAAG